MNLSRANQTRRVMESNDATLSILLREGRIGTYLELTQVPPWSINYVCGMRPWALKRSR